MKDVIRLFTENPSGCLATVQDGKPRVRPWGFMGEKEGRLYFCTANNKEVYQQLKAVPFVEYSVTSADFVTVRVRGEILFTSDRAMKEEILAKNELVRSIYQNADNPIFEIFYMEHGHVIVSDFSGQPPRTLSF